MPSIRTRAEKVLRPARGLGRRRALLMAGATLGAAVLIFGSLLFFSTSAAAMRIRIDDPKIAVQVDGLGAMFTQLDKVPLRLRAGQHELYVKYGVDEFRTDRFILADGEEVTLRVDAVMGELFVALDERLLGTFPIAAR